MMFLKSQIKLFLYCRNAINIDDFEIQNFWLKESLNIKKILKIC